MNSITITIEEYPGWETSMSPYRLTINGRSYRPMTAEEVNNQINFVVGVGLKK